MQRVWGRVLGGTAVAVGVACTAGAVEPSRGDLVLSIDRAVETAMERDRVPGVSIALELRGELLAAKGYGYADLENRVPATEHTVYRIGSVTKQFTAAAILKLAEQGRLSLEDPIDGYLPSFDTRDFHVDVAQLLDHTSGIKGYTEMPEFWEKARLDLDHQQMLELMSSPPFEFEPGERYQYSNSAYYLAGLVIEKVTGGRYADFLEQTFFQPLGLFETHYLYNDPIIPNRAEGYELRDGELVNDEPLSMHLPFAAGALGSSARDLLSWLRALSSGRVVSPSSFERMTTPATLLGGGETHYGLGLSLTRLEGRRKVSHGGGINGFLSYVAWLPQEELFVVVLANSTSARPGALANQLVRLALGLPEPELREVPMSEEALRRFVGKYELGRSTVEVTLADGSLMLFGQRLVPTGEGSFAAALDPDYHVSFQLDGERVVEMRTEREGSAESGPRIE